MKVNSIFAENGKTFQEIIEQFLVIYYTDKIIKNII